MDLGLNNKKALILGSSTGLGFAIAKALADEGARVCLSGRNEDKLQAASQQISESHYCISNFDEKGAGTQLVQEAAEKLGGLDILVTNTGGPPQGRFLQIESDAWETAFNRIWLSAVESMRAAIALMAPQKSGAILLSLSTSAIEPIPTLTTSNGLRAGLIGLMKSIMAEETKNGIRINALLPGFFNTDHLREVTPDTSYFTKQIPMGRLGEPEEYGALAAFLLSNKAAFITGQAIAIDGGLVKAL